MSTNARYATFAVVLAFGCHQPIANTYSGDLVPEGTSIFHVTPNDTITIPKNDATYVVTANGQGAFTIAFTDSSGGATTFAGTIVTSAKFTSFTTASSMNGVPVASLFTATNDAPNIVNFSSTPGARIDEVTVVAATDPIYLTAYEDGSPIISLLYDDNGTLQQETLTTTPAGFSSP